MEPPKSSKRVQCPARFPARLVLGIPKARRGGFELCGVWFRDRTACAQPHSEPELGSSRMNHPAPRWKNSHMQMFN